MKQLADVNLVLALLVRQHQFHEAALSWWRAQPPGSVGLSRIVQLAVIRLLGTKAVMQDQAIPARIAHELIERLLEDERIAFWQEPATLDLRLRTLLRHSYPTPKFVTDAYLAAFAQAVNAAVATFDAGFRQFPGLEVALLRPATEAGER
ncbi:MAG: PIN domain-containing protein [Bryobacterales bacterium]|nr:PIN domain-containing protein [Bryobacterales bacterium]